MKVDLKHKLPIFLTVLLLTGTLFFTNKYISVEEKTISANNPLPGNEKPETVIKGNVQQSWLSEIQSSIEAAQYNFTSIGKNNFVTFNKAHALSTEVTPGSMEVSGMDANNDKWNAALMLHSVNSNLGNMHTGDLISTDVEANKLIYNYNNLSIEYINTTDGIRQNFIVKSAPEQAENVSVILNIESKLNPHLKSNTLILSKNNSQLYKYSDLKVWDKNGKPLQANMSLNGNQLALNVDVRNAEFPVTIDPLSTTYAWKHTGGQSHAGFGFWVSGNGDVNGDGFSDIAIGAPEYTNTHSGEGAVFVFHGSPSGLLTTPSFVSYGGQDSSGYGRCVSIEGDVDGDGFDDLIIGAHEYDNPQKNEGRVWLHRGSISGVEPIADWNFETNRKGAKGGESVSIVDDVNNDGFDDVVIGARGWDNDEELGDLGDKAGKFWVYLGSASGLGAIAHMECVGQVEDAELGVSTDGAGDVNGDGYNDINIGGYIFLIGDGMICTFHGGEGGPDNIPDFMAIGGANDTSFYAVNLSNAGDINGDGYSDVVIGMPRYDTYGVYNAGKMRYHLGSDLGLDTTKYDLFGEGQYNERWAFNVNDAGDLNKDGYDDILLTAKNYAPPGSGLEDSVGRGYMFLGSPHGLAEKATWTFDGESVSGVGTNIALAGDVNGDSLSDIILSGDGYSGSYTQEGAVYIFHGIEQVCDPASSFTSIGVGSTTATFTWDWVYGSYSYKVYLNRIGVPGPPMVMTTESNSITVTGLVPGATYKCYVKTQCQAGWTGRSNFKTINTTPTTGIDAGENNSEVKLYPNPVTNILNIETGVLLGETNIRIYDAKGEVVMSKSYNLESVNKTLQLEDMSSLPEGFYFVEIQNNNASVVRKISKTK